MARKGNANGKQPAMRAERAATATGEPPPLPSLENIHPRHMAYVRTMIARLGVSPAHEREDLVQEVLIQAHRSKGAAMEPRALLFGITRHVVFRWISRREHERGALKTRADEAGEEPVQSSAEDDWQARQRRDAVHASIEELPPIFRRVFVSFEIDGMPMAEVAKEIGIRVNTGYTRLHLARARFAEAIRRHLARRRLGPDEL